MKMNKLIGSAFIALTLLSAITFSGCATGRLAPGGVYNGDAFLYEAENTINTAHETFREFLIWETAFRNLLPEEVSKAADFIRVNEHRWLSSAHSFRDVYALSPTLERRDKLQLSLSLIQTALREAASYMAASKKVAPNNGLRNIKPVTLGGPQLLVPVK